MAVALLENVAFNLRALCAQHGSIYRVCRELGMAPQQFGHYLAAERLPNEETRRRLCAYFRIDEDDLIRPPEGWGGALAKPRARRRRPSALETVIQLAAAPTTLDAGLYFTYFLGSHEPDLVVRSVTVVRKDSEATRFFRLTGYSAEPADLLATAKGKHRGVVIEHAHWIYLIGQNAMPAEEPSYLAVQWRQTSDRILAGYGIVSTISGPSPAAVVLKRAPPDTGLRRAIRAGGAFDLNDGSLDAGAVRILKSLGLKSLQR
jgi:transcriptional regulator with XRE-family HTH domain